MSKDLEFIYNCDDCHVFILTKPFLSAGLNSNTFTTVRTPYITIFLSGYIDPYSSTFTTPHFILTMVSIMWEAVLLSPSYLSFCYRRQPAA